MRRRLIILAAALSAFSTIGIVVPQVAQAKVSTCVEKSLAGGLHLQVGYCR